MYFANCAENWQLWSQRIFSHFRGHTAGEVIILKYPDLQTLLAEEQEAGQYYNKLPDYVKQQISTRAQSVNSFESLRDYAENLLRGDG